MDSNLQPFSDEISQFLQTKSKEELVEMILGMSKNNAVQLTGVKLGAHLDTTNEYKEVVLDGYTFTPEELVAIGYDTGIVCSLSKKAWERVHASRKVVDDIVVRIAEKFDFPMINGIFLPNLCFLNLIDLMYMAAMIFLCRPRIDDGRDVTNGSISMKQGSDGI